LVVFLAGVGRDAKAARCFIATRSGLEGIHAEGVAAVEAFIFEELFFGFFGLAEVVAEIAEHLGGVGVSELLAAELDDEAVEDWVDGDGA